MTGGEIREVGECDGPTLRPIEIAREVFTPFVFRNAVDPTIAEVDLWVTVPADAGKGAIVSGDFAMPTSATVFATTVPRASAARPSANANVFWDPKFRSELQTGSTG